MKRFMKLLAALAGASLMATAVHAQANWPDRAITMVVPFTPGGVTDTSSRLIAKLLGDRLGVSVVVENKPGVGGSLGVGEAVRRPADGYTLIYGTSGTHGANLALYKDVGYDPIKDFIPLYGLSQTPLVLTVTAGLPVKTVDELVEYARKHPGELDFGSAGTGTGTHLSAELFQLVAGIEMTHVPYRGSSPALNDLMGGSIDVMFDYSAVVTPMIEAGKLRALAVTSDKRLPTLPDVPTMAEAGYPEAKIAAWGMVFAPANTPPAITEKLADALESALNDPEFVAYTQKNGSVPFGDMRGERLQAFIKSEAPRWFDIVQRSGTTQN